MKEEEYVCISQESVKYKKYILHIYLYAQSHCVECDNTAYRIYLLNNGTFTEFIYDIYWWFIIFGIKIRTR